MLRATLIVIVLSACGSSPPRVEPSPTPSPGPEPATTAEPLSSTPASTPAPAPTPASLYDRLGGKDAITAVVDEFVGRTTTDPRIADRFFNTDASNLKKLLAEFVCAATGGPCKYTGRDMPTSHAGMEVVEEEWTALVEDLVGALDKFKVPAAEKNELLGALGPLKPQIVAPAESLKPIDEAKLAKVTKLASTLQDKKASELLARAVVAGKRGQRSYAEQLFARAEMTAGAKTLASVAGTFRSGAPPLVTTATKKVADTGPQPTTIGGSEAEFPDKTPAKASLKGTLTADGKPASFGVVTLWPAKGGKKRTPKVRTIEQRDKHFAPQVMAVPVGSTISFPNFDKLYHNVFSLSKTKPFDLGMYKSGETREVKVDKPGIIRLGCNIHANMSAYLVVVDAPHYVIARDGTFEFKNLAPGTYKVQLWTETSAEPTNANVVVKEGANDATFEVAAGTASPAPNKFGNPR
jgi:hemoglobin